MNYISQIQKSVAIDVAQQQTRQFNAPRPEPRQSVQTTLVQNTSQNTDFKNKISEMEMFMLEQKNKFDRFVFLNQNRIQTLEKEVSQLRAELEKKTVMLDKLSDKATVEKSREALFNRKDRAPLDRPIDRNNVAPSQVQIENIFNCSGKRF